jgi:hypothetical protein
MNKTLKIVLVLAILAAAVAIVIMVLPGRSAGEKTPEATAAPAAETTAAPEETSTVPAAAEATPAPEATAAPAATAEPTPTPEGLGDFTPLEAEEEYVVDIGEDEGLADIAG